MVIARGRVLVPGSVRARALRLTEPVSFWGGIDPATGVIVDRHHPQVGESVSGRMVAMRYGRGSSSASTVVAEMVRRDTAPAGMLLARPDPILVLGAVVAFELYQLALPMVLVDGSLLDRVATGDWVAIAGGGAVSIG